MNTLRTGRASECFETSEYLVPEIRPGLNHTRVAQGLGSTRKHHLNSPRRYFSSHWNVRPVPL